MRKGKKNTPSTRCRGTW